tara:strand:+ start:148 stop:312 length:165 start_codon:yes stop_codon:yes gene_type:complete
MSNDKMIYNDDQSIGVDEKSLNKFDSLFNHNNDEELYSTGDWDDFHVEGNKLWL